MKSIGAAANAVEKRGFRRGHPNLAATLEPGEQGGTTIGVEVGGNLVEQQDRRSFPPRRDQLCMGKDEA